MFINTFGPALKVPSIHFCVIMFSRLVFRSIIVIMKNEASKKKKKIEKKISEDSGVKMFLPIYSILLLPER